MCRCAPKGLTLLSAPALSPLADSKAGRFFFLFSTVFSSLPSFYPTLTHTHTYTVWLLAQHTNRLDPHTHTHTPSLFFYSLSRPRWLYSLLFSAANSNTHNPPAAGRPAEGKFSNAGSITPALFSYIYSIHTITCGGEEEYYYICWESTSIDTRS